MSSEESWNRMEDGTECKPVENHRLCANGCGFFGSATTLNLCSKCYRDFHIKEDQSASVKAAVKKSLQQQEQPISSSSSSSSVDSPLATLLSISSESSIVNASAGSSVMNNVQLDSKVKNRCLSCKKRIGLTGFNCRCGSTFCSVHRYPEEHACTFDFKAVGRDAIAKANPVVKADKVERF